MRLKGFILKQNAKAEKRIRDMGEEYYIYRQCFPIYKIEISNTFSGLYFCCDNLDTPIMYLLGFSFEGLVYDEEKWNEIEQFGKYRCEIQIVNDDFLEADIKLKEFVF